MSVRTPTHRGEWYWETFNPNERRNGRDLAALRRGIGRPAGDVPEMWRYYRSIVPEYEPSSHRLRAEHAALALFAVHQQSQRARMHTAGVGLGTAVRKLNQTGAYSSEAIDRRMHETATATSADELVSHLRGLITQLRSVAQPLDYTRLRQDIEGWHSAYQRARIRSRWGSEYFRWSSSDGTGAGAAQEAGASDTAP
ncbi:type I-E CRISPR-associated protein Cse2/CasB [Streptomyces sp. 8K308]|uniref:type I-E CRISPR-associated protein Cse2/CasB n=1 Tax=Streptomyces sp. 8K308 TaxID=2530388 RepID=UPI0010540CDD|nr:type I-E CRISPR-associated protein Cse2/CasB [Streptomyces sp. 8K308]TDC10590.1 type I-E CRISPR-associated protein Cse2/CasB [Streptomyces sp. 8K308]